MFSELKSIKHRPEPFSIYTAEELWTDTFTSQQMLTYHLNPDVDISSRNAVFITESISWITSEFGLGPGKHVADFGCGPGLYANALAQSGASVTGIDFSERTLDHARAVATEKGLQVEYVHQNYLDFSSETKYDLVTMIMCDFCALSPEQRRRLLTVFQDILSPDGAILLDAYSLEAFDKRTEASCFERNLLNGFWSAEEYYGFLNTFKYDSEKVILDKYTIVEEIRTRTIYNWLQYFDQDKITAEFAACGLQVSEFYGDVAGNPFQQTNDEFAVVATLA